MLELREGTSVGLSPSRAAEPDDVMGENLNHIGPTERPEVRFRSVIHFLGVKIGCACAV